MLLGERDEESDVYEMTRQQAEDEALRRWTDLHESQRRTHEQAETFAAHLEVELDFYTVTSKHRLISAWLIREIEATRRLEREAMQAIAA
jgi:hypothetical protein